MFKKIILVILSFLILYSSLSADLKRALDLIEKLPEAKALMEEVKREGGLGFIETSNHKISDQFGAFWDFDRRVIVVSSQKGGEAVGKTVGSILFELQNAKSTTYYNDLFDRAERRQIDRQSYIQAVEYQEYINSKRASAMAEKGIALGLFPVSARLFTYSSFEEHFHYQQVGGHSALIGELYDQLSK